MKFLTSGKLAALIPQESDFDRFVQEGHTDASSYQELLARYNKVPNVAVLEVSMDELNDALKKHRSKIEESFKRSGNPLATFETTVDGKKVISSVTRSTLAAILASELAEANKA